MKKASRKPTDELRREYKRSGTPMPDSVRYDGGSEADRKSILAAHDAYLRANAAYDWQALKAIWSDDPTNVFFNMNGHTYVGLEHWSRLWRYYAEHKESGWWEPFDVKVIVRGDMAVVTCHRKTKSRWRPETGKPDAGHQDKSFTSRSTMVLVKEHGEWKTVHAHFSEGRDTPRPGNV
jgi:ketosteroid isomerase-like protein